MKVYVDVLAKEHGSEEVIASAMAERDNTGEYRLNCSLNPAMYAELILVDSDGRHKITTFDILHEKRIIVFQTIQDTEAFAYQMACLTCQANWRYKREREYK